MDPEIKNKHGLTAAQTLVVLVAKCELVAPMARLTGEANLNFSEYDALEGLNRSPYVDYCRGRCIKVNFSQFPDLDYSMYLRDSPGVDIDASLEAYAFLVNFLSNLALADAV